MPFLHAIILAVDRRSCC